MSHSRMHDDTIQTFGFPAISRKKLIAAFDGGRITSDGGGMLLSSMADRLRPKTERRQHVSPASFLPTSRGLPFSFRGHG